MSKEKYLTYPDSKLKMLISAKAITPEKKEMIQSILDERASASKTPEATPPAETPAPKVEATPPVAEVPVETATPPAPVAPPAEVKTETVTPPPPAAKVEEKPKSIADMMAKAPVAEAPKKVAKKAAVKTVTPPPAAPKAETATPPAADTKTPVAEKEVVPPAEGTAKPKAERKKATNENDPWEFEVGQTVKVMLAKNRKERGGEIIEGKILSTKEWKGFKEYIVETEVGKMNKRQRSLLKTNPKV